MKKIILILFLSGCAGAWNAMIHPDKCGTNLQRASFVQAEPCAVALRKEHLRMGLSPKLGTYMRQEHYRVTRNDYPPIMTEQEKQELAQLSHQDLDLCIEYSPVHHFKSLSDERQIKVTYARVIIPHVEVSVTIPTKPDWCSK